jgi:predicted porin
MKKSLIVLAALAASSAAMAQSSVTLSGRVDAALYSETTGVGAAEITQTGLGNGGDYGLTGSRWALSGTEDLGGGLKAMFKLENRFNIDDGMSAGGFRGDAFLALAGGFGTVKLGRTYTAFDDARSVSNGSNVFDSAFTPSVGGIGGDYTSRGANGIRYESPVFAGFSGAVSYSFGEDKAVAKDATSIVSMHVKYATGPLTVAYGYQDQDASVTLGSIESNFHQLSAAYDLGIASLSAGYTKRNGTNANGNDKGFNIGVNVPVGAALNVSAGFAREETEIAGNTAAKAAGFGLGATYNMSKRTILYTGFKQAKTENGAGAEIAKQRLFAAGVRHNF